MSTSQTTSSSPDPAVMEAIERGNVVVFLDVSMGEDTQKAAALGRIKLELFVRECPKTCENFRQLCTGEHTHSNGSPMGYKNCAFHRVMRDFMIQGGDFVNNDGSGKMSIYGSTFADENLTLAHNTPGVLSMANSGANSNGCQFFVTTNKCEWLDGKHVVFGRVLDSTSMLTVRKIEAVPVSGSDHRPRIPIRITQCGEL